MSVINNISDWQALPADRYARHRLINWWKQDCLEKANVLVVGAGALGNEALKNLALLGVGHITIIDFDIIEPSNLSRTVLFREQDVGRPKAEVAAEAIRSLNPALNVDFLVGDLEFAIGLSALQDFDVALGCLDSVNARYLLNKMCQAAEIPWINAGINPVAAEVGLFAPGPSGCYGCSMTEMMWQNFRLRQSCQKLQRLLPPETLPTTAPVAALAAAIQVQEALALLHGFSDRGTLKPGQKLFFSIMPYSFFIVDISRSETCECHNNLIIDHQVIADPRTTTATELFTLLKEQGVETERLTLTHDILTELSCTSCENIEHCAMPVRLVPEARVFCPTCNTHREALLTSHIEPGSALAELPLYKLGIPPREVLAFSSNNHNINVELINPGDPHERR